MVQWGAVGRSGLQCVAVWAGGVVVEACVFGECKFTREFPGVEVCCSVLQYVAVWAHGVAVEARVYGECGVCTWIVRCCSVIQCVAVCCSVLQ